MNKSSNLQIYPIKDEKIVTMVKCKATGVTKSQPEDIFKLLSVSDLRK